MDTRKDEYVTIRNTEGMPVKIQYLTNAEVLVLYDTYAAVYDTADGTELYRYSYGGRTLQSAAIQRGQECGAAVWRRRTRRIDAAYDSGRDPVRGGQCPT